MKKYYWMIPSLFLTACSSYQEHFECPPGKGVGCQSVSQVDQLVNQGDLPLREDFIEKYEDCENLCTKKISTELKENTQKIWIAPFKDTQGKLHEETYIFVKAKPLNPISLRGK